MMAEFNVPGVDKRFLDLLATAKPIRWGLFHHAHTSTYYRQRMVLLGDSAHASLPFQAAGAGQGVEDALILSAVLAQVVGESAPVQPEASQIYAALEAYDYVRRPRAQKQLEQSAELGLMIYFLDPDAGSDMEKILPRLQQGRFEWLWFHDLEEDVQTARTRLSKVAAEYN
jgi:salicylate hydroxylase